MTRISDAIAGGMAMGLRRVALLAADLAGKAVWVTATAALVIVAMASFASGLSLPENLPAELGGFYVSAALAERWPILLGRLLVSGLVSFALWSLIEAFVRSHIVRRTGARDPLTPVFFRFLASGILRRLSFGLAAVLVVWVVLGPGLAAGSGEWMREWADIRWAGAGGVMLLIMLAFVLMLLDTLLRCDAVDTLGPELISVVAVVAAIGLIEVGVRLSALMATVIAVRVLPGVLVLVVAVPVVAITLSVTHSYLLVVRYSAIGIIRHQIENARSIYNGSRDRL